ncbi:NAD(P)H-quinone oxidoreductase subunit U, chloroplastic [Rhododendron vialii]|uniref:NAD(P)H-quinone oxidoreductase subunit U, chloroplastic n=1 Tax=Rhododendron vialii TaxID=182163 RepID=UPI00265EE58D|nr:NAD(P)H-quinone oxidoreductase subunit U, chloroplastic [Rhododendron vialii]
MAVSSSTTAAALHYISKPQQNYAPRTTTTTTCSSCSFSVSITSSLSKTTKKPLKVTVRSSSSDGSPSAEAAVTQAEAESESPIELPKGPPSVISTLNVERALRGIPITDIDYYGSLGIQKGCSNDQVYAAYKNKVEELMNKGFDEEELSKKLEVLKESYAVLSNVQERRLYDWSLARKANQDKYLWPYEVDNSKKSSEPIPEDPEDVVPTRLVGYFFLAWCLLAVVLSIGLNR